MLESRNYYHNEMSRKSKGWNVEVFYTFGGYTGSTGHSSKKKAEEWLRKHKETDNNVEDIKRVEIYKI
mgnify:FL=1